MSINNKRFESWNEKMARKYNPDQYYNNLNPIVRFIERKRLKKVIKFVNPQESDRIIELGCGAGNIIEKIKSAKELVGIDISDFLLNLARSRKYQWPVKFIKGNIEQLPEQVVNSKFDKIYCSEVLEHTKNPEKVLKEIKKIAKKNSIIVISIPNEKLINKIKQILQKLNLFNLFFSNLSRKMDDEWHLHVFELKKFKKIIRDDYVIQKIKSIPFNFLPLRYVIKLKTKND
jgi:2-polyprenyl-3-methyl-5-hydroxy-6-metoxy-1,4-benzoquinol methylase